MPVHMNNKSISSLFFLKISTALDIELSLLKSIYPFVILLLE